MVAPTYGEHVATWKAAGHAVEEVASPADAAEGVDVLVVTNPNNPDGRIHTADDLTAVAARLAANDGWLVVDEAFADVAPEISLAPVCDRPGIVVLRSFGKFHGLAGLRLGFALTAPALAERLAAALGPWAVNGPAIAIGRQALADDDWTARTRERLAAMSARLDEVLTTAGLVIAGGTDLFRLTVTANAAEICERLGWAGILVRDFPDHPRRLRFGLPPDDAALARLAAALAG